jgi:hypothetical protein
MRAVALAITPASSRAPATMSLQSTCRTRCWIRRAGESARSTR